MNPLPLTLIGHLLLRQVLKQVSEKEIVSLKYRRLVKQMIATMRHENGVGLAANQVGFDRQVIVLECKENPRYPDQEEVPLQVYFNPKMIETSIKKESDWEGCLSIPGYRGMVPRAVEVTFEALDRQGKKIRKTFKDFAARIIQHEVDHIQGFFYIDRMLDMNSLCSVDEFNRLHGTRISH